MKEGESKMVENAKELLVKELDTELVALPGTPYLLNRLQGFHQRYEKLVGHAELALEEYEKARPITVGIGEFYLPKSMTYNELGEALAKSPEKYKPVELPHAFMIPGIKKFNTEAIVVTDDLESGHAAVRYSIYNGLDEFNLTMGDTAEPDRVAFPMWMFGLNSEIDAGDGSVLGSRIHRGGLSEASDEMLERKMVIAPVVVNPSFPVGQAGERLLLIYKK